jgi:hypothetical protein
MVLEFVSRVGREGEYLKRLGGYSRSGDINLAVIQQGKNVLSII